jgi:hypothetical protein
MAKPPADPAPSREWTAEDTFRYLTETTEPWTAKELASLFQMWRKAGQATIFKVLARLLKEKALTDAYVAALKDHVESLTGLVAPLTKMGELAAELQARNAELANPAAALARKRMGTTSTKKPWRKLVLASKKAMREVHDPDVERAALARRLAEWLEKQGVKPPLPQAIDRWIKELRARAAAQAR